MVFNAVTLRGPLLMESRNRVCICSSTTRAFGASSSADSILNQERIKLVRAGSGDIARVAEMCTGVFHPSSNWAQRKMIKSEVQGDMKERWYYHDVKAKSGEALAPGQRKFHEVIMAIDIGDGREEPSLVGSVELELQRAYKRPPDATPPGTLDTGPLPDFPYLANLAVIPGMQGRGIGSLLVDACDYVCFSWGMDEILLKVEESNKKARSLYERKLYEKIARDEMARKVTSKGLFGTQESTVNLWYRKMIDSCPDIEIY